MRKTRAKTILSRVKQPDTWFGLTYSMNLYRGCTHGCIYCDSRSLCYGIEDLSDVNVKENAIEVLRGELSGRRRKGTVGTGSMNDPYQPLEAELCMTRRALEELDRFGFPVHVMTKSDLVARDSALLQSIGRRNYAAVSVTITTADDELAAKLEPGAPRPSKRLQTVRLLASRGIYVGIAMMPLLPYICDSDENVAAIVRRAADCGASYVIPWFGMTLRDRQRWYFYDRLDRSFPGMRRRYSRRFGRRYYCASPRADELDRAFYGLCEEYGLEPSMRFYEPEESRQLSLFRSG